MTIDEVTQPALTHLHRGAHCHQVAEHLALVQIRREQPGDAVRVRAQGHAAVLVQPVDDPEKWGIAFLNPDGTLEKLVEKPPLHGTRLANTGAYVFPPEVFDIDLKPSPRGEYEITDYVSGVARTRPVQVVQTKFWLPIGTVEAWQSAQDVDLDAVMTAPR